MCGSIIDI